MTVKLKRTRNVQIYAFYSLCGCANKTLETQQQKIRPFYTVYYVI